MRNNRLIGRCMYWVGENETLLNGVLANDPEAMFSVGWGEVPSIYDGIPAKRLWRGVNRQTLGTFVRDEHPFYVWDAGASSADTIMAAKPNMIQWQADADGRSLSETYLANVAWE